MASAPMVPAPISVLPLRIQALAKRFGELTAVDGITVELHSGECLGLLAPNGAGKSTLIRSIVGRLIPDSGKLLVFAAPADSAGARIALGWVPQDLALYPRLTCRENLEAFGQYHGLRGSVLTTSVALVPGVGRARRSGGRRCCEFLRRNEATAQHGSRTHP